MDPILQAYTGLTVENKGEDGIPHRTPIIAIDMSTALYAYSAVSTALYARRDEPRGRHIEASLLQAAAGLQVVRMMQSYLEGGAIRPPGAPSGVYQVADGWMTITVVRLHEWLGFCKAVDLPLFGADERYRTTQGRYDHATEINAALRTLLASQPFAYWSQRLAAERIMHEQLNSYTGFLQHPHVEASGAIAWLHHPHVPTEFPMPQLIGAPPLVDGSRLATSPGLGEHTEAILHEHAYTSRRNSRPHRPRRGRHLCHPEKRSDEAIPIVLRTASPPAPATNSAKRSALPHVVEEPGDRRQPVVRRDDTEVGAVHHRIPTFRRKLPREANPVVVAFDLAGAPEPMARELLLHTDNHRVDALPPFALQHRIEIARPLRPGLCNKITATPAVSLVPRRDIAIDQIGQRIHVWLLGLPHPMWCGGTHRRCRAAGRLHRR